MTVREAFFDGPAGQPVTAEGPLVSPMGSLQYVAGLHGAGAAQAPGGDFGSLRANVSASSWWVARWYTRIAAGAPSGHTFLGWVHTAADAYLADFQLRNTGGGAFYNRFNFATNAGSFSNDPAPRDEWLRVEYEWKEGDYSEVRVWRGVANAAEDTGTPDLVFRRTGISGVAGLFYLGTNRAAGHAVTFDSFAHSDTSASPGPFVASTPAPARGVAVRGVVVGGQVRQARMTGVVVGGRVVAVTSARVAGQPTVQPAPEPEQPAAQVTGFEVGSVTSSSATLVYDLERASTGRAVMSSSEDFTSPVYGTTATSVTGKSVVTGLPAGVVHYAVEVDGVRSARLGSFRTARAGAASFRALVASCAGGGTSPYITGANSNAPTFEAMRAVGADLWLHPGDRHYKDPGAVSVAQHVAYQAESRAVPRQRALLATVALAYHPDDHELANNWSGAHAGAAALLAGIDEGTAHYPWPAPGTWAHTWAWGRVRFVMLDSRSKRTSGSILGAEQQGWLDDLLRTCTERAVVLDTNVAFIGDGSGSDGSDAWGAFPASQRAVAEGVTAARARGVQVMIVAGDAHMIAMDDGTNSQYDPAQAGVKGAPVCHFGPMDSGPSVKGGPYSGGTSTTSRYQYGVLDVTDENDVVRIVATGYRVSETAPYPSTQVMTQTLVADGTRPVAPAPAPAPQPSGNTDPTVVVQSAAGSEPRASNARQTTLTLPAAPVAGRLVTAAVGIDKSSGTVPAPPAGWTQLGAPYVATSVSQVVLYRVADGTAADRSVTVAWSTTSTGTRNVITEWGFAPSGAPVVDVPAVNEAARTSASADAGAATAAGLGLAFVSIDSAPTGSSPWAPTWSAPYAARHSLSGLGNSSSPDDNGGASIGVAAAALASGASSAVTVSTTYNDQTTVRVARFPGSPA